MRSAVLLALALCVPVAGAAQSRPDRGVRVRVVELGGGRAYLTPGMDEQVRPGSVVVIRGQRLSVAEASRTHAVVLAHGRGLRVGDVGQLARAADADTAADVEVVRLPPPQPLVRFRGIWPRARRPADAQRPSPVLVPLVEPVRGVHLVVQESSGAIVPLGGRRGARAWGELRLRARAEPLRPWLGARADVAVRAWSDPSLDDWLRAPSNPSLLARAAEVRLGRQDGLHARAGRLAWAAHGVGMLDGVRVQAPVRSGLTLAAFGGVVPDAVTTSPSVSAARFGAEIALDDADGPLAPDLVAVVQGSVFDGVLDERRLLVAARLRPTNALVAATAELDQFPPDEPSGAGTIELGHLAVDGELRLGSLRLGARLARELPERSWLLRSRLPEEWACSTPNRSGASATEPCEQPDQAALFGAAHASLERGGFGVAAGVHVWTLGTALDAVGGFASGSARVLGQGRLEVGLSGSRTAWLDTLALRLGAGATLLGDALDASIYVRPAVNRGEVEPEPWVEHAGGLEATVALGDALLLTAIAEVRRGRDDTDLVLLTNASYSP